jgi:hypothetical protein
MFSWLAKYHAFLMGQARRTNIGLLSIAATVNTWPWAIPLIPGLVALRFSSNGEVKAVTVIAGCIISMCGALYVLGVFIYGALFRD